MPNTDDYIEHAANPKEATTIHQDQTETKKDKLIRMLLLAKKELDEVDD